MSKPTIFSKRIIPQKQNNGNGLNVVLITMDTTRRDHISVCNEEKYGVALPYKVKIPGLKQLAKDSTVFTNAITPISSTGPAHTSMLTGLYPISFGVHRNGQALPQQITALPEILLQRGYKTAAFISGFPLKSYLCGLQQGFEVYNDFFQGDGKRWEEKASFTTKKAIKWIKNAHYPYFLWLHYYDPHALYRPPEPFKSFYDPDYKGHFDDIIAKYWHEKKKIFFNEIGLTPRDIAHGRALYAGEISYMDSNIGEVLYYLRHSSAWKKTIVIAVADHGEYLAEHGFFFHHDGIKEQLMRIPLIIHIPDAQVPKIKVPVSLIDLSPTILELLSINNPKFKFDGLSLKPLILQHSDRKKIVSKQFNNRILFGEFLNKLCLYERNLKYVEVFDDSNDIYSVPNPFKWKKIREFVYDIKKDPYETQNLINKNFSRQKQAKMKETIQQWFISSRFIEKHRNIKEDETVIRSLKALGYIQY